MKYEELRCQVCGAEQLVKQSDGTYVCEYCRARYRENDLERYKEAIKGELRGVVTEALLFQRAQDIANIRRNLFEALKEEYTDSYKIVGYCRELKKLLPNDFQARCFEVLNNGNKWQINAMLESVDVKGEGRLYVKDILESMIKSLAPENLLALKSLADRALEGAEKTKYLNKIEEESGKCEAGLYSPEVPRKAFIAYSSRDMAIVTPLVEYLESMGISCFVALRNMRHGRGSVENYEKVLKRAMHNCKSFVFVSTRNSRRFDCDAMEKEIPYVKDKEPKVKRIEYLVEDYGENESAIKATLKEFFGEKEWVRNKEDLPMRIMGSEPQSAAAAVVKYCLVCGAENAMDAFTCKRCEKREFGTGEEYEARRQEVKRQEKEQKAAARRDAEKKEAARIEAEKREAAQEASRLFSREKTPVAEIDLSDFKIEDGVLVEYSGEGGVVIIPNSVTSIGKEAFEYCESLTSITIPDSVTSIGDHAFYDCESLTSITIPNSVTSIGRSAFYGCKSLTSITIPKRVTSIEWSVFSGCSSLTSITIPNSVTSIGDCAFEDCESLTSITIPNSVTSIGEAAFSGCSSLTSITIPNSVTSIEWSAFSGCSSLTSITIPNSVTSIGWSIFSGCIGLEEIKVEKGNPVCHSEGNCLIGTESKTLVAGCKNSKIPADGSVTSIGECAFYGCESLTSITIPKRVTSIGECAFYGCESLTSITIPNSVTSIEQEAFSGCSSLTSITIPNSVTSIEQEAFSGCSSLTSITIPKRVTSIGDCAFYGCESLTSITIPKRVTSIGEGAFGGCIGLEEIKVEKRNLVFHSEGNCLIETKSKTLVAGCKNSKIPADGRVTSIGEDAFYDCKSLTSITTPNSVTSIGRSAFYGCKSLTSITIPNSVTSIERSVFSGCSSLTSITIPDSVTSIGGGAFAYCVGLTSITIPNSVTSIGEGAFYDCESLTSITIPDSVASIGKRAFEGCSSLTSITIPNSVTSIERSVFSGCSSLTSITIPKRVTSIGEDAFYDCESLTSVTIPNSVTRIYKDAFEGCSDDLQIYCSGVEPMVWPAGWDESLKGKVIWAK